MSDLDRAALSRWTRAVIPNSPDVLSIDKFPGGQSNPTYRVETEAGSYVLRRKPFGQLLPSAHAVDREYRLISALYPVDYPVPRPIAFCGDTDVIGAPFYLMELVEGRTFWDATLRDVAKTDRRPIYEAMIDTQAALHNIDYKAVGLADFGAPGAYVSRQVDRWTRQYRASQTDDVPEIERLIEWLPRTIPDQTAVSIIHGDYRLDNLIFAPDEPRIDAVIDWELATIGDPLADFAYLAMNWALPSDGRTGLADLDLNGAGLPTLDEAAARYCVVTERESLPDLHWYFAYNLFRLVGIIQGIKKRMLSGNASSAKAAETVEKLLPLAKAAWTEARKAGATL